MGQKGTSKYDQDKLHNHSKTALFLILICCVSFFSVMCGAPPEVEHGRTMGSNRERYPVNSIVRYQCDAGYTQRHLPVIHCMPDGQWTKPQVECTEGESAGKR